MRLILFIATFFAIQSSVLGLDRPEFCSQIISDLVGKPEQITALQGGMSGAELFAAEVDQNKYVIRFMNGKTEAEHEREITAFKRAFELGYGPRIYHADAKLGIIVMEYLTTDPEGSDLYPALGRLARKIHSGPALSHSANFFDTVAAEREIYLKSAKKVLSPEQLEKIDLALATIREAAEKFLHSAPCHRDLHKHNLFFSNGKCLAIDFELAAQEDPFVDLAIMAVSYGMTPVQEMSFLYSYFEREPTSEEELKLYLMKQVRMIYWGFGYLNSVQDDAPELAQPMESYEKLVNPFTEEEGFNPAFQLGSASLLLHRAFDLFDSEKTQEALRRLGALPH